MIDIFEIMESGWLEMEVDNWHLKEGAPTEIVEAYEEYLKKDAEAEKNGRILY